MARIRSNNENSSAAAVVDTAAVASRGPLHTASQGPLSPAMGVFDTSNAAARRTVAVSDTAAVAMGVVDTSIAAASRGHVTVSDTVTVVPRPCLKKTLKYSTPMAQAQVQSILRKVAKTSRWTAFDEEVANGWEYMEKNNNSLFKRVKVVYGCARCTLPLEDALAEYAAGNASEWNAQWDVLEADSKAIQGPTKRRTEKVKSHYEEVDTILSQDDQRTTKVSFGAATVVEFALEANDEVPGRKRATSLAALPASSMKIGGYSTSVKNDKTLDDYSKQQLVNATRDWVQHGNKQALALDQQPLPRTRTAVVFSKSIAASQAPAQAQAAAVSDTAPLARVPSPCLKKALKYSSQQQIEAQWQSLPADAFHINEQREEEFHSYFAEVQEDAEEELRDKSIKDEDKEIAIWYKAIKALWQDPTYRPRMEDALLAFSDGDGDKYDEIYDAIRADVLLAPNKDIKVAAFHDNFQANTTETRTIKVSFATVTATQYVLTEAERKDKLLGEKDSFPNPDFKHHEAQLFLRRGKQSLQAVLKRKGETAGQEILREQQQAAAEKDWKEIGNKQALQLDQQPLPQTNIAVVFSEFGQSTVSDTATTVRQSTVQSAISDMATTTVQSTVSDTATATVPQSTVQSAISDMTTTTVQSTVSDTATATVRQSTVQAAISDMATTTVQSARPPSSPVVTETTSAASVSDTVAPTTTTPAIPDMATATVQSAASVSDTVAPTTTTTTTTPAIPDMAVVVPPANADAVTQPTLRRSARIAARSNGSGTSTTTRGNGNGNRVAAAPLRRSTRKGAAKPKGFYKV